MKLVFASTGADLDANLDQRFGRCSYFVCYDTESKEVNSGSNSQNLNAAQGAGIQAATTVAELGADYVFCGHCGPKAFLVFKAANIKVICGVEGKLSNLIKEFEAGNLKEVDSADVEGHWM
jgi:predicted Fe-Mo cluster-binding NifX family protein